MNWEDISKEKNLTIEFLQEHQKAIEWMSIGRHILLSKTLLETFPNHLMWFHVVKNPSFTMELVEEIKDEPFVKWGTISMTYPITKEFYDRFNIYIDESLLLLNPNKKVNVEKIKTKYTSKSGETITKTKYVVTEKKEEVSHEPALTLRIKKSRKNTASVGMGFHFSPGSSEKGWI